MIYNVDDTGVSIVQKQNDPILVLKERKQVGKATSVENIPPMLVYPRKNFAKRLRTNVVRSSEGGDNGSTTLPSVVSLESHNDAERPSTSLTVQGGEHLCQI